MITKNACDTEGGSLRVLLTIFLNRCEICDGTKIVLCTILSPNRLLFMVKQFMHVDFVIFCKYYCCLFSYGESLVHILCVFFRLRQLGLCSTMRKKNTKPVFRCKTVIYKLIKRIQQSTIHLSGEVIFDIVCIQRESESTCFCRVHPT